MSKTSLDPKHFDALRRFKAGIFKVLAHPTRIHVIETLRSGELSVGAILDTPRMELLAAATSACGNVSVEEAPVLSN